MLILAKIGFLIIRQKSEFFVDKFQIAKFGDVISLSGQKCAPSLTLA